LDFAIHVVDGDIHRRQAIQAPPDLLFEIGNLLSGFVAFEQEVGEIQQPYSMWANGTAADIVLGLR